VVLRLARAGSASGPPVSEAIGISGRQVGADPTSPNRMLSAGWFIGWASDFLGDLLDASGTELERPIVERQLHRHVALAFREQLFQVIVVRPGPVERPRSDLDPRAWSSRNQSGISGRSG
jgi:hypothetical protein